MKSVMMLAGLAAAVAATGDHHEEMPSYEEPEVPSYGGEESSAVAPPTYESSAAPPPVYSSPAVYEPSSSMASYPETSSAPAYHDDEDEHDDEDNHDDEHEPSSMPVYPEESSMPVYGSSSMEHYDSMTTMASGYPVPSHVPEDVYITAVYTSFTTYCPKPTTLTYGPSTYTVTSASTITITDCPSGCEVTCPVKSLPPVVTTYVTDEETKTETLPPATVTALVPYVHTVVPSPTTITIEKSTITVTKPSETVTYNECPEHGCQVVVPVEEYKQVYTDIPVPEGSPAPAAPYAPAAPSAAPLPPSNGTAPVTPVQPENAGARVAASGLGLFALVAAVFAL